ncbi:L-type lectin-domain containing receptor kinase IX.1 [Spatholobus suberectus]|nr:L-type lectin-domain containing receptor kinase IX.1 [Spatholobus suberectus]
MSRDGEEEEEEELRKKTTYLGSLVACCRQCVVSGLSRVEAQCEEGKKKKNIRDPSSNLTTDFTTCFFFTIDKVNFTDTTYDNDFTFYFAPSGYQIQPNSASGTFDLFNDSTTNNLPEHHIVVFEFDTFVGSIDPPGTKLPSFNQGPAHATRRNRRQLSNGLTSLAFAKFDVDNNLGKMCHAFGHLHRLHSKPLRFLVLQRKTHHNNNNNNESSISYQIDLKKLLPEWVNIGFSASTGLSTERNVIYSWEFSSTLNGSGGFDNAAHKGSKSNTVVMIFAVVCPVVLVFVVLSVAVLLTRKKRRRDSCMLYGDDELGLGPTSVKFDLDKGTIPRRFEYKELVDATNGFSDDGRLGQGASGQVYKRVLMRLK